MVAYFATVADLRFSRSSQQVFAISFRGAKVTRREGNAMSFLDFFEGWENEGGLLGVRLVMSGK